MRHLLAATCIACMLLAAPAAAHEDRLAGADWVLAGATGKQAPVLRFDGGRVGGTGGCNRFGGRYVLKGDSLTFSPLMATRMACRPDIMKAEQAFFEMLAKVKGMVLAGDTLELTDGEGQMLARFSKQVAE